MAGIFDENERKNLREKSKDRYMDDLADKLQSTPVGVLDAKQELIDILEDNETHELIACLPQVAEQGYVLLPLNVDVSDWRAGKMEDLDRSGYQLLISQMPLIVSVPATERTWLSYQVRSPRPRKGKRELFMGPAYFRTYSHEAETMEPVADLEKMADNLRYSFPGVDYQKGSLIERYKTGVREIVNNGSKGDVPFFADRILRKIGK